jgi:transposase
LKPLPARTYAYAAFKKARVNIDYHVEFDGHNYSVPYELIKDEVELRITTTIIEVFYGGKRFASHARNYNKSGATTCLEHMPKSHQKYADWSPERMLNRALKIGPSTYDLVQHIMKHNPRPEQRYTTCVGIIRLAKKYSEERLESACKRSLQLGVTTRKSVSSILAKSLDKISIQDEEECRGDISFIHANIRGSAYYERYTKL